MSRVDLGFGIDFVLERGFSGGDVFMPVPANGKDSGVDLAVSDRNSPSIPILRLHSPACILHHMKRTLCWDAQKSEFQTALLA
eukprot:1056701-Amphidinium_carterae.1